MGVSRLWLQSLVGVVVWLGLGAHAVVVIRGQGVLEHGALVLVLGRQGREARIVLHQLVSPTKQQERKDHLSRVHIARVS